MSLEELAASTTGMTGAELDNMLNQAALRAATIGASQAGLSKLASAGPRSCPLALRRILTLAQAPVLPLARALALPDGPHPSPHRPPPPLAGGSGLDRGGARQDAHRRREAHGRGELTRTLTRTRTRTRTRTLTLTLTLSLSLTLTLILALILALTLTR